jgi:hypothetical protein
MLQNYGSTVADVFQRLEPLLNSSSAQMALAVLERDFGTVHSVGPLRVAEFLGNQQDETILADAAGAVRSLLSRCRKKS